MINKYTAIAIVVAIAVIGVLGYYYVASIVGYSFEIYGSLDMKNWEITSTETTVPTDDYSIITPSTSEEGIGFLQTREVIIVVQIADKTFQQNLGEYSEVVANGSYNTFYNVVVTHIPTGPHKYTVFLYETTGLVMKSRILKSQMDGYITVGEIEE